MEQSLVLQRFWDRALNAAFIASADQTDGGWNEEIRCLNSLGIAMEVALNFLYANRPDLSTFRQWLQDNKKHDCNNIQAEAEDVLSAEDLRFWEQHGYVVVKDAVAKKQCTDARDAIWNFLDATPDDPASWYKIHEEKRGLMLKFFDHPALDINRRSGRILKAYEQLYGTTAIYKTIDKVSFNPPENDHFRFMGSPLHWDTSLQLPIPFCLQGLLYLTDCTENDGAFHCVPGFQHKIGGWLNSLPPDASPRELAPQSLEAVHVPGEAGDFVIWHQALPHGATPNRGQFPRLVQYLTYLPENNQPQQVWI